jgi:hypothetical protein
VTVQSADRMRSSCARTYGSDPDSEPARTIVKARSRLQLRSADSRV